MSEPRFGITKYPAQINDEDISAVVESINKARQAALTPQTAMGIRVIAEWEEDGKSWRERYEELKASCVAKPQPAPDKVSVGPYVRGKPRKPAKDMAKPQSPPEAPPEATTAPEQAVTAESRGIGQAEPSPEIEASGEVTGANITRHEALDLARNTLETAEAERRAASEPVIISAPDHIGIYSESDYQAIYDAAPCRLCGKLLRSANPEERCRCGE